MAHIILTGATGTAGAAILAHALKSPTVSHISVLSRRPVKLAENESKANVILHDDFNVYPQSTLDQLQGATACIWAQGRTSRGMSEQDYTVLTHDYPIAAAKAFAGLNETFNFVYMSGEGADPAKPDGGMLFARVKGKAERSLLEIQKEMPSLKVYNIRPGGINPEGKYLADRTPSLQDRMISWMGMGFEKVWKSMVIGTDMLARASVKLAVGDGKPIAAGVGVEGEGRLLRNTALRRLGAEV